MKTIRERRGGRPGTPAGTERAVPEHRDPSPPGARARPPLPTQAADEQALLCQVASRDPAAFEQLAQCYTPRLRGYLRRLLPPQVPPEDVLLEVLLAVWSQAARYDPRTPLVAWLFGMARHKARKAWRRTRPGPVPPPPDAVARTAEALEVRVTRDERARAVTRAVASLPPAERQVVELTYYRDMSYPEIAAQLACPVNTIKTRMVRARRRLAPLLVHWS